MSKNNTPILETIFTKDYLVTSWCCNNFLKTLRNHPKVKEEYERSYLGSWENPEHPTPYKEVINNITWENICEHKCPCCERNFYGYKHRVACLDCNRGGYRNE